MYEFYIDGVRLPVTPGEISFSNGANIDIVDLANGQKITRWIGRELETITFKASFPFTRYAPFVYSGVQEPRYYIDQFKYLTQTGTPFEFVILNSNKFNSFVRIMYIQSLQRTDSAENGSEPELEFTLLEWVEKKTIVYSSNARKIDITVEEIDDETNETSLEPFDVIGDSPDFLEDAMQLQSREERLNKKLFEVPEYHIVFDKNYVYKYNIFGSLIEPTKEELDAMPESQKIEAGYSFNYISIKYYGTINFAELIRKENPQYATYPLNARLPTHAKIKLVTPTVSRYRQSYPYYFNDMDSEKQLLDFIRIKNGN